MELMDSTVSCKDIALAGQYISFYEDIQKDAKWNRMSTGPTLRVGSKNKRVTELIDKMQAYGFMDISYEDTGEFTEDVESSVKLFQEYHGLEDDGLAGKNTIRAINVSPSKRISQIKHCVDTWKTIETGKRHIVVNIPEFKLYAINEDGTLAFSSKVIVGRTDRETVEFTRDISYIVVNPYWNIPVVLANRDVLPEFKNLAPQGIRDHFNKKGFQVLNQNRIIIDPGRINWKRLSTSYFPYYLRQVPGPTNVLGKMKFMMPNKYFIYLHDTPHKYLFDKRVRTFSSGCIRVKEIDKLKDFVISKESTKFKEVTNSLFNGNSYKNKHLTLKNKVKVSIIYTPSAIDNSGSIRFYPNVYGKQL